jgi:histidine kinase 2/3/4 (cytokinin receptor)
VLLILDYVLDALCHPISVCFTLHFGEMQDTFAKYTAMTSFERPLLNGIAYAERIFPHEKEMFERKHGWIMKTMNREAAPLQEEYAPVIFSQDTVSYLARMDMMSGEVRFLIA